MPKFYNPTNETRVYNVTRRDGSTVVLKPGEQVTLDTDPGSVHLIPVPDKPAVKDEPKTVKPA